MAKKATAPKAAKAAAETSYDLTKLQAVVAATQGAAGFLYTSPAESDVMVAAGLVEVNASMTDGNGSFATRATQAGIEAAGGVINKPAAKERPTFAIDSDVAMPTQRRFGSNPGIYPFESMEVGQSFFVEATAERDNVAKSMASTISSANKRYKNEDGSYERKFSVRNVETDEKTGKKGARIFRTA